MLPRFVLLISAAVATSCQTGKPSGEVSFNVKESPTSLIGRLAKTVQKCWFQSDDPAFRAFRLANEVTSLSGRPRLLLVPSNNTSGLPSLVIQAENSGNGSTGTTVFGPLLSTSNGQRIASDVRRWGTGSSNCKA